MTDSFDKTYRNSGVAIGQYLAVAFDASGELVVAGANEPIIGFCQRAAGATVIPIGVRTGGHTKAIAADGNILAGDYLKTAAAGEVTSVGAEDAIDVFVVGIAEMASGAQGDQIEILIAPSKFSAVVVP
jgi:hypothetical protein